MVQRRRANLLPVPVEEDWTNKSAPRKTLLTDIVIVLDMGFKTKLSKSISRFLDKSLLGRLPPVIKLTLDNAIDESTGKKLKIIVWPVPFAVAIKTPNVVSIPSHSFAPGTAN